MNARGILIVVSGFAGTGKGTLMNLLTERNEQFCLSVSMTTRAPRPGEEDGVSYFFVTREEFEKTIRENGFIEHAEYVGNYYGTPRAYVEKRLSEGMDVILEIEIQGAMKVKREYPDALLVFILPPSAGELKNRLVSRGTEEPEVILRRLQRAAEESEGIESYDYVLINDDLETCYKELLGVIRSAHFAAFRNEETIREIRRQLREGDFTVSETAARAEEQEA